MSIEPSKFAVEAADDLLPHRAVLSSPQAMAEYRIQRAIDQALAEWESRPLADRLFSHDQLDWEAYESVLKILGADPEKCSEKGFVFPCSDTFYDPYDGSIEIVRAEGQIPMTKEQVAAVLGLGFCRIFETIGEHGIYHVKGCDPGPCRAANSHTRNRSVEAALKWRIAEMSKLLDDTMHKAPMLGAPCHPGCPRCAWEKLKQQTS